VIAAAALLAVGAVAAPPPTAAVERRVRSMGTWLTLRVEAVDRPAALAASERAIEAVAAAEDRLTTWSAASELSRLNAAPAGQPFALSAALARDLAFALDVAGQTERAFDPTVGALARAYDLRGVGRKPTPDEIAAARAACGPALLTLDGRRAVRRHPDVVVDEGAFGKGVGLDDALVALAAAGAAGALLDFGGQLAALGPREYEADLADPRDRARPVLRLRLSGGSFSTSGHGVHPGHLLDPRSGRPAPGFGSASVWAPGAALADALSTALFVLGPEEGPRLAAARPGIEAVSLTATPHGLRALATAGLRGRLEALIPELTIDYTVEPLEGLSP